MKNLILSLTVLLIAGAATAGEIYKKISNQEAQNILTSNPTTYDPQDPESPPEPEYAKPVVSNHSKLEIKVDEYLVGGINPAKFILSVKTLGAEDETKLYFNITNMILGVTGVTFTGTDEILVRYQQYEIFADDRVDILMHNTMKIKVLRDSNGLLTGEVDITYGKAKRVE